MGIGIGTFMVAVGAILTFAIDANHRNGFNINAAGIVLMIVGAIAILLSLLVFAPRRRVSSVVEQTSDDGTLRTRRTVAN